MAEHNYTIRRLSSSTQQDYMSVANTYLAGWAYTRPIDDALVDYWRTLPTFDTELTLIAYDGTRAVAALHGEVREDHTVVVHLLSVLPGMATAGAELLRTYEAVVGEVPQIVATNWSSQRFYGGYVLGSEPYHPHWAVHATEAFVRAGYRVNHSAVVLVRDLTEPILREAPADGYEIVEVASPEEFSAEPFGFQANCNGAKAAHCYARWFPRLGSSRNGSVGQIGNVTTEEAHRSHGLARKMVTMSLERLAHLGADESLIATGMDNLPALRAYERVGFRRRALIVEWGKSIALGR